MLWLSAEAQDTTYNKTLYNEERSLAWCIQPCLKESSEYWRQYCLACHRVKSQIYFNNIWKYWFWKYLKVWNKFLSFFLTVNASFARIKLFDLHHKSSFFLILKLETNIPAWVNLNFAAMQKCSFVNFINQLAKLTSVMNCREIYFSSL